MSEPLKVLLVEDEALILMQLEMLLEDEGHIVLGTAMTADAGIAAMREMRPDLVFVDLRLADGSSGLDVARSAREVGGVTCVFITANPKQVPEDLEGAAAVVAKPFSGSSLEQTLAFLEQGLRSPPPSLAVPAGMTLSPAFQLTWAPSER